jgi:hypothetical protein
LELFFGYVMTASGGAYGNPFARLVGAIEVDEDKNDGVPEFNVRSELFNLFAHGI